MMDDRTEWFAPKRYGYGTGWPIAWQGWAVLAAFTTVIAVTSLLLKDRPGLQATIIFPAVAILLSVLARTTRGGWRWRWGERD
jgi:hypothetical protein